MTGERDEPPAWSPVSYLFRSENRYEILGELPEEFTEERELATRVDSSRATVHRCLREFAQAGWADRDNTRFRRTPVGRTAYHRARDLLTETDLATAFGALIRLGDGHGVEFDLSVFARVSSTRACDLDPARATVKYHERLDELDPVEMRAFLGTATLPVVSRLPTCSSTDNRTVLVETSGGEPVPEAVEDDSAYRECPDLDTQTQAARHVDIVVASSGEQREAITAIRNRDKRVVATAHGSLQSFVERCRDLLARLEPEPEVITP